MCVSMLMSSLHISTVNQVDCYPPISGKVSSLALHCVKHLLLTSMSALHLSDMLHAVSSEGHVRYHS